MGPIRSLIKEFRENRPVRQQRRQERRQQRRAVIRELFSPLSAIDNADRSQGVAVRRSPGKLFRSVGVGTANQQVLGRNPVKMPADRKMQNNPDGPDTGKDAGRRPYDGDGQGKPYDATTPKAEQVPSPKQPRFTTTSQQSRQTQTPRQERVPAMESGSSLPSLPSPTTPPSLDEQIRQVKQQLDSLPVPTGSDTKEYARDAHRRAALNQTYSRLMTEQQLARTQRIAAEDKEAKRRAESPMNVVNEAMRYGEETGDWGTAIARAAAPDAVGPANPYQGEIIRNAQMGFVRQLGQRIVRLAENPGGESGADYGRVVNSFAALYPQQEGDTKSKYKQRAVSALMVQMGLQKMQPADRQIVLANITEIADSAADLLQLKDSGSIWGFKTDAQKYQQFIDGAVE